MAIFCWVQDKSFVGQSLYAYGNPMPLLKAVGIFLYNRELVFGDAGSSHVSLKALGLGAKQLDNSFSWDAGTAHVSLAVGLGAKQLDGGSTPVEKLALIIGVAPG